VNLLLEEVLRTGLGFQAAFLEKIGFDDKAMGGVEYNSRSDTDGHQTNRRCGESFEAVNETHLWARTEFN